MGIYDIINSAILNKCVHFIIILLLSIVIGCICHSCTPKESKFTTNTQSMIEFPEEFNFADNEFIPDYLDPDKVLCKGKGLKVGRCISNQLKKGICLGIIKHEKRIYAIEIPCNNIKEENSDSTSYEQTQNMLN